MNTGPRTTPTNTRRAGWPGKRRRICGAEVANQIAVTPSPSPSFARATGFAVPSSGYRSAYQPNQNLYDGHYEHDDSDLFQENTPHNNYDTNNNNFMGSNSGPELVKMMQEQQHLLQQVLETQKQMQLKQRDFDEKLEELKKISESCSSSPSSSPESRKKTKYVAN